MSKYAFLVVFAIAAVLACNSVGAVPELPAVGTAAPSFNLTSNEGKQVSLNDFKGKWVVLYFYPKDFTSGCIPGSQLPTRPREVRSRECGNTQCQRRLRRVAQDFCAKEGLAFKLLSDTDAKVSGQYGSIMEYRGNKLSARNTFLIDPKERLSKCMRK